MAKMQIMVLAILSSTCAAEEAPCSSFSSSSTCPSRCVWESGSCKALVGNFSVSDGPRWNREATCRSCVEVCALLFGGVAGDYQGSTSSSSVDRQCNADMRKNANVVQHGWWKNQIISDTWKCDGTYSSGEKLAYVLDHSNSNRNYCWQTAPPCDATTTPANGGVGDCTNDLASGSSCQPTCSSGYTVSGPSSCSAGTLTPATCQANPCDASTTPANGGVGDCTNDLASGSSCQPTCSNGYTVSGPSSCSAGTLTPATCQATCIAPSTTGYNFAGAGGIVTSVGFKPNGATCARGYAGTVSYAVCDSAGTAYSVSGCQLCTAQCSEFRNGATGAEAVLCVGPQESFGSPCYLPNRGECNADWRRCETRNCNEGAGSVTTCIAPTAPTPAPATKPLCKPWCRSHHKPWSKKCGWAKCEGCESCCASHCSKFRNGATGAEPFLCVGPRESNGSPCYLPKNGMCNADWRRCVGGGRRLREDDDEPQDAGKGRQLRGAFPGGSSVAFV